MLLNLDDMGDEANSPGTCDRRLVAARQLPPDVRNKEVATALCRQFVSRRAGHSNELAEAFEAAFPRGDNTIASKSVLASLLGVALHKGLTVLEAVVSEGLQQTPHHRGSSDAAIEAFRQLEPKEQVHQLSAALVRQHLQLACGAEGALVQLWERTVPAQASHALSFSSAFAQLLQVPDYGGDDTVSILEHFVQPLVDSAEAQGIEKSASSGFEFAENNTVDINGFRVSSVASFPGVIGSLAELDINNAVVLGKGAGGSVLRVQHRPTNQFVAVKQVLLSKEAMVQVQSEVRVLWGTTQDAQKDVWSPCLINCHNIFYDDAAVFFVLELMDGSLKSLLDSKGACDEAECAAIAWQVLTGLAFMHEQRHQQHRDIKPHNCLFRRSDGTVKISDFGISSKPMETLSFNKAETFCGTMVYMSPSKVRGDSYGYEADLWSFGIMMLQLACGKLPFPHAVFFDIMKLESNPPQLPPVSPKGGAPFSDNFRHFISLCFLPKGTPSASAFLKHPWLASMTYDQSRQRVFSM